MYLLNVIYKYVYMKCFKKIVQYGPV